MIVADFKMIRLGKLQLFGPLTVLLAVGAAEGAAFCLDRMPNSKLLWFLNLKVFAAFQVSYYLLGPILNFPYAQFFLIALPLFVISISGLCLKQRFLLALGSHLSLIYAGFLFYCMTANQPSVLTASLTDIAVPKMPIILLVAVVGPCLISFLVSQSQYFIGFSKMHSQIPTAI
jgi:hypothetical protein